MHLGERPQIDKKFIILTHLRPKRIRSRTIFPRDSEAVSVRNIPASVCGEDVLEGTTTCAVRFMRVNGY